MSTKAPRYILMIAIKCVKQTFAPNEIIIELQDTFRKMLNDCIRIGLQQKISTMKRLSLACYPYLARYNIMSYYKYQVISKAAGILSNYKKSVKRGVKVKKPYSFQPQLGTYTGFKYIQEMGVLKVPIAIGKYFDIMVNKYVMRILADPKLRIRSFQLNADKTVSIAYSTSVEDIECNETVGMDRNVENVTCGNNEDNVAYYNLSKAGLIADRTKNIVASFKRNDARINKKISSKYGQRRKNRVTQMLHLVSKRIANKAKEDKTAIVFEKLTDIRNLYRKGNFQGRKYRGRMNSWPHHQIKQQVAYKAQWLGVPIVQLNKAETMGTSSVCSRCGKRTQAYNRKIDNPIRARKLYCENCDIWIDRDVNAVINQSVRGLQRLCSSKGVASEAMVLKPDSKELVIQRVDATKLKSR